MSSASAYADVSWLNTPSYRPSLRNPTFVKEQGLSRDPSGPSSHLGDGGDKGLEVRGWYEQFAKAGENETDVLSSAGVEALHLNPLDDQQPVPSTSSTAPPPRPSSAPVPPLSRPRPSATAPKHKSSRASNPHWFISHSLLPTHVRSSDPVPFSLSAPPSSAPSASNLASLLTLPDPGQAPKLQPPPHFHLKPGNKGYDLIVKAGWGGRGLGRGAERVIVEPKGKGRAAKEEEEEEEEVVEVDQEGKIVPQRKKRRKREREMEIKTDPVGPIDLTLSSASSSTSSDSDSDAEGSHTSSLTPRSPPPPPPRLPSSSTAASASDQDGRFHLLAPLSTTLKPDRLGIRSAESMARYKAVTHGHKEIRDAARAGAVEEGRLSAKAIRKRVERERKERVDLMGELKGD